MSHPKPRVAVIGAGMSGIAAAHFLNQNGYQAELLEAEATLGGRAGSARLGDKVIDIGGKNIGRKYRLFRAFLRDCGAPPLEYFGINSSTFRGGKLRTVDSQRKLASLVHVLSLVGPRDFARLAGLARLLKKHPEEGLLGGSFFSRVAEEKDHQPLSHWFGAGTVRDFLRPITLRMNGAEPDEYSFGCLGSNLRMLLDSYDQLSLGMADLLERFEERTLVSFGTRVVRLVWSGRRVVGVEVERDGKRETLDYAAVVLALPAPAAARLLPGEAIERPLVAIRYNPVTLVVARYRRPIFDDRVRAIVFGPESPLSNAGAYGVNDLNIVRYTLSGRQARFITPETAPADVVARAESELARVLKVQASERVDFVFRHFSHGLCAYGPYHHRFLQQLQAWESGVDGLILTGDYVRGASIEACFEAAREGVARLLARSKASGVSPPRPSASRNHAAAQPSV